MYKVTICGHFGGNKNFSDGQTVKTKNLYKALVNEYGFNSINKIDTYNWKKHPFKLLINCVKASKFSDNIIILPAHNGVKLFVPLFTFLKKKHNFKLFYAVVGGWLVEYLTNKKVLENKLKLIDNIFVETKNMKNGLEKKGFDNVSILVNFKNIQPLNEIDLKYDFSKPYHLCVFSRIMEEKGIEDVIKIVKEINEEQKKIVYILDIYGPIDNDYLNKFNELKEKFPHYIKYKGCVDSDKSVNILKDYYLLLFPTRFKTEGIPGTIVDALFSGLPVIATKWENVNDILEDQKNAYLVDMYDTKKIKEKLIDCLDKNKVINLKKNVLNNAYNYTAEKNMKDLVKYLK